MMVVIPKIFHALLSHSDLFPGIGDVSPESGFISDMSAPEVASNCINWIVPRIGDEARAGLAAKLSWQALHYVFLHEFCHIYNGHTDWRDSRRQLGILSEINIPNLDGFAGVKRQTIEWDADSGAVHMLLRNILNAKLDDVDTVTRWTLPAQNDFGTVSDGVSATILACQIVHMLFDGLSGLSSKDIVKSYHPHPAVRQHLLMTGVIHALTFRTGVKYTTYMPYLESAVTALFVSWTKVFQDDFMWPRILSEPTVVNLQGMLIERYTEQWALMHDDLDKLKRGGRIAPKFPRQHPAFPENDLLGPPRS
jgi:hypothetical protein